MKYIYILSFASQTDFLPAIFPSVGLFKPLSANDEAAKSDTTKDLQGNKITTKKDKRRERHERFLKSRFFLIFLMITNI